MGTQTNIANRIIDNKVDYILVEKENQEQLVEEINEASRKRNNSAARNHSVLLKIA